MRKQKIYIDTSVIGGCLDEEFSSESTSLFELARKGDILFVISDVVLEELDRAPVDVQVLFSNLPKHAYEIVESSYESETLRDIYLDAEIVGSASRNDAHHVAIASVERVDMIVSWNFKHIVHLDKIRGFNAVNLQQGYPLIEIRSPREIV
ncbi:MAG TPA: PIN domain-containing protein [Candidatus Hydrogenedentes bacterium]|nr:PIN domain-containing protein [Candidatus Hydrogenedentota bacterium]